MQIPCNKSSDWFKPRVSCYESVALGQPCSAIQRFLELVLDLRNRDWISQCTPVENNELFGQISASLTLSNRLQYNQWILKLWWEDLFILRYNRAFGDFAVAPQLCFISLNILQEYEANWGHPFILHYWAEPVTERGTLYKRAFFNCIGAMIITRLQSVLDYKLIPSSDSGPFSTLMCGLQALCQYSRSSSVSPGLTLSCGTALEDWELWEPSHIPWHKSN